MMSASSSLDKWRSLGEAAAGFSALFGVSIVALLEATKSVKPMANRETIRLRFSRKLGMLLGLSGTGIGSEKGILRDTDADEEIDCATISPIRFPMVLVEGLRREGEGDEGILLLAAPVTRP